MADTPIMMLAPTMEAQQLIDDAGRIIARDLQESIAALPYAVGKGIAPHPLTCLAAGAKIAARFLNATIAAIEGERAVHQLAELGWQPVADCPKDGTLFDVIWPDGRRQIDCFWQYDQVAMRHGQSTVLTIFDPQPSHFRLPPPPPPAN